MIAAYSWTVAAPPDVVSVVARKSADGLDPLGFGIVRPFRRTERADWATDSGVPEVLSCVGQILGTDAGTLPWRYDFGINLQPLRHRNNTAALGELARVRVEEALRKWTIRAELRSLEAEKTADNVLTLAATLLVGGRLVTVRVPV